MPDTWPGRWGAGSCASPPSTPAPSAPDALARAVADTAALPADRALVTVRGGTIEVQGLRN